jgi:hypothetical protein
MIACTPHGVQDQLALRRQTVTVRVQLGGKFGGRLSHADLVQW